MLKLFQRKEKIVIDGKKYSLKEKIGEGAYADVLRVKAKVPIDNCVYFALKRTRCETAELREDSLREISILKRIDHANVLSCVGSSVVDSGKGKCEILFVMPLMVMGTLQHVINRGKYPSSGLLNDPNSSLLCTSVPSLLYQCLLGLAAIHEAGYRHADLKPDNILLHTRNGGICPVLSDLGSATALVQTVSNRKEALAVQEYAASHTTASYRSPELWDASLQLLSQSGGLVIDGRADVWSFGCILHALLFSQTPFESPSQGLSTIAIQSGTIKIPVVGVATPEEQELGREYHVWVCLLTYSLEVRIADRIQVTDLLTLLDPIVREDGRAGQVHRLLRYIDNRAASGKRTWINFSTANSLKFSMSEPFPGYTAGAGSATIVPAARTTHPTPANSRVQPPPPPPLTAVSTAVGIVGTANTVAEEDEFGEFQSG